MRTFPARLVSVTTALAALALLTGACGSSTPKTASAGKTTTTTAADPNDSAYCQTARTWMVHEFNGDGDTFANDPAAFKKYWGEWLDFIATAARQAPAAIRADWSVGYDFEVKQFTPVLEKYDFDVARAQAEGTPAELAIGKRVQEGGNPAERRAQSAVREYEGRVCQTAQPPAAKVSFAGVMPNKAYCDAVQAADEAGEQVAAKKWAIAAVRAFVTSDDYAAMNDKAKQVAPAEIKADVEADADWSRSQQVDVLEKFGYDVRKLVLDGTAEDRAIFQKSDPAIADHYARTVAYQEQVCGA